jgi:succinate dehydrogenase/fumarate reductase flavoprotein subunit
MRGLFGLPFSGMLSTALCGGYAAGTGAGKSIKGVKESVDIDPEAVRQDIENIRAPLKRNEGYSPKEFEDMIRQIMEHYMGHKRSLTGLNIALEKFQMLEEAKEKIKAADYHEMTRAQETIHLLKYCQLMIRSVIERKGMRGFYNLVDYPPKLDSELRDKYVVLSKVGGEQTVTFEPQEQTNKEAHDAA